VGYGQQRTALRHGSDIIVATVGRLLEFLDEKFLRLDSLQVLEVIAELEDRFDISIPLNDVPATRTVAQIVEQVGRLVAERPAS